MRSLSKYLWMIIDYGPSVITVVFASYVALKMDYNNPNVGQMLAWVLIVLVLIATTQLVERLRGINTIQSRIEELSGLVQRGSPSLNNMGARIDFAELAQYASTIDILAWSGINLYTQYENFLVRKIEGGCRVRFLIIDENSHAARAVMENALNKELVSDIVKMKSRANNLGKLTERAKSNFELRTTRWVSPVSMIIVDGNMPTGVISLSFSPIYLPSGVDSRRIMFIEVRSSPENFNYYKGEFEKLWDHEPDEWILGAGRPTSA